METNKNYVRKPFDVELAKKIQSGEVEGRIVTKDGILVKLKVNSKYSERLITISRLEGYLEVNYSNVERLSWLNYQNLFIELPEEAEIVENGDYVEVINSEHLTGQKGVAEIMINTPFPFVCGINQGKLGTFYVYNRSKLKILKKHNEVTPKHEFKPFDKVLVRDTDSIWSTAYYSHYNEEENKHSCGGVLFDECIPYAGHEYLVGTTDKPKELC